MRPISVVSSANIRSLTEGSLDVQSLVYWEKSSGERTQPWGAPVLIVRCWMRMFPASLAAACLSGSCWSTDRWRWGWRAVSVYSEGCPGWLSLKRTWSLQTGSSHKSLVCPDASWCFVGGGHRNSLSPWNARLLNNSLSLRSFSLLLMPFVCILNELTNKGLNLIKNLSPLF